MTKRMSRDEFLARKEEIEERAASNDAAREETHVRFLMSRLKFAGKKKDMLRVSKERTGRTKLTLDLFNEMVPNFPILMAFAPSSKVFKLHLDNRVTLPALYKRFQDAPFVAAYSDWYEQAEGLAAGRAVGLLFPRKGIVRGFILHDGEGLQDYWVPGLTSTFHGGTREKPSCLYLQCFGPLIEAIYNKGHGWKPEFAF